MQIASIITKNSTNVYILALYIFKFMDYKYYIKVDPVQEYGTLLTAYLRDGYLGR